MDGAPDGYAASPGATRSLRLPANTTSRIQLIGAVPPGLPGRSEVSKENESRQDNICDATRWLAESAGKLSSYWLQMSAEKVFSRIWMIRPTLRQSPHPVLCATQRLVRLRIDQKTCCGTRRRRP